MTAVPLGQGAYRRLYAGAPEVKLVNRWLEANPANPREGTSILARPGTTNLINLSPGSYTGTPQIRGLAYLPGVFNDVLWAVSGPNLYYVDHTPASHLVSSSLIGTGTPEFTWQVGAGYARIWLSDGGTLYYSGGAVPATGTITEVYGVTNGQTIKIGSMYYEAVNTITGGAGTSGNPWQFKIIGGGSGIIGLELAINGSSTPPGNTSPGIVINPDVMALSIIPVAGNLTLPLQARIAGLSGNSIPLTVISSANYSFNASTMTGGLDITFNTCPMPGGVLANSLTQVSGYVLVSVQDSQEFFWVNPGETTIDALSFANKESGADPIVKMRTVGDQVLIMGTKSTENWYATGNSLTPFSPIQGRVYARGVIDNTPVVVNDGVILVGDDGRVYNIGFQAGDSTDSAWGVTRISNNGIEERIRRQIRREAGLTP